MRMRTLMSTPTSIEKGKRSELEEVAAGLILFDKSSAGALALVAHAVKSRRIQSQAFDG